MSVFYGHDGHEDSQGGDIDMKNKEITNIRDLKFTLTTDHVNFENKQLKGVSPPIDTQDAINKGYLDANHYNKNRLTFTRYWSYEGISTSLKYPRVLKSGYPISPIFPGNISEETTVTLVNITFDNDNNNTLNGVVVEFNIQYALDDNTTGTYTFLTYLIDDSKMITLYDGQSKIRSYALHYSFKLSDVTVNYKSIVAFFVGIRKKSGPSVGNEMMLVVDYDSK